MAGSRNALLAVILFLATAFAAAAAPPAGEVSAFVAGIDPFAHRTAIAPGAGLGIGIGGGVGGTFTLLWSERVATRVSFGVLRLPLTLRGSAAGSGDGGSIDLTPLTVLGQRRFSPRGRTQAYAEVGVTYPFLPQASLSATLRNAGVDRVRRPDHPAFVLGTGADVAVAPRTAVEIELRWAPYAETLVVLPRGAVFKSQRLGVDFHPVTLSAGLVWRAFR